jgi:hypothetical protein
LRNYHSLYWCWFGWITYAEKFISSKCWSPHPGLNVPSTLPLTYGWVFTLLFNFKLLIRCVEFLAMCARQYDYRCARMLRIALYSWFAEKRQCWENARFLENLSALENMYKIWKNVRLEKNVRVFVKNVQTTDIFSNWKIVRRKIRPCPLAYIVLRLKFFCKFI